MTIQSCKCLLHFLHAVLPKFEVTLTGPEQLERDDKFIEAIVEAKYTFGENVAGRVKVNATLMSSQRGESLVFYDQTGSLVRTCMSMDCSVCMCFRVYLTVCMQYSVYYRFVLRVHKRQIILWCILFSCLIANV